MPAFLRLAVMLGVLAISTAVQAQGQIPWAPDYDQAVKAATEQRKLLLLHFYNDNCEPCVRVEQNIFSQPQVAQAIARNYIPVKIHAGAQPKIAEHFRVDRWPTDLICTSGGLEIARTTSPATPEQYVNLVDQLALQAGVGAARQWTSTMQAAGQPYMDQRLAQAQTVAGQAAGTAQAAANQAGAAALGYTQQAQAAAQQANQQVNQQVNTTAQQLDAAAQQAGNAAQQLGNTAQQFGAQAQNSARDLRAAWDPAALRAAAGGAWTPNQAATTTAPPTNPQPQATAVQPCLPTANPWIGQQTAPPPTTLQPAGPTATSPTAAPPLNALTADQGLIPADKAPPIALEGFCPVTLLERRIWQRANPQFGAIHRDRTYLFASAAEQQKFLANPDAYSPALSGFDPVIFQQRGELVEGKRSYGLTYNKQIFLFADEANLATFKRSPQPFATAAHQAMMRAETGMKYR